MVSAMCVSRLPLGKCDVCVEAADGKCDVCVSRLPLGKCDACVEAAVGKCDVCVEAAFW